MDKITNLSAKEYAVADDLHIKFRATGNVELLEYLAATLYVAVKNPRPAFDKNNLHTAALQFKNIPTETLMAVELTWAGCKNHLAKKFKYVFPKTTSKKSKIQANQSGFGKTILSVAGGKFGTFEETENTNIYTLMEELDEILKQAKNGKKGNA
ncbi:hypothetical protein [Flavobacterium sp. 3HN19-14]|uniref:hypothetical protein n=1 Tax=Flavobacterium sp. 3HN19-14 TaxID=3448133 RepID=UPI003EDFBC38